MLVIREAAGRVTVAEVGPVVAIHSPVAGRVMVDISSSLAGVRLQLLVTERSLDGEVQTGHNKDISNREAGDR